MLLLYDTCSMYPRQRVLPISTMLGLVRAQLPKPTPAITPTRSIIIRWEQSPDVDGHPGVAVPVLSERTVVTTSGGTETPPRRSERRPTALDDLAQEHFAIHPVDRLEATLRGELRSKRMCQEKVFTTKTDLRAVRLFGALLMKHGSICRYEALLRTVVEQNDPDHYYRPVTYLNLDDGLLMTPISEPTEWFALYIQRNAPKLVSASTFADLINLCLLHGRFIEPRPKPVVSTTTTTVSRRCVPYFARPPPPKAERIYTETCVACLERKATVASVACLHVCLCLSCSKKMRGDHYSCPICRASLTRNINPIVSAVVRGSSPSSSSSSPSSH